MDIMKKRRFGLRYILIAIILCYAGYTFISQELVINRLKGDIQKYTVENKKVEDANSYLKDQIEYAGTDEYVEKMAREKMGLVKSGETVYVINNKE
jgi:cell division protein FtsB